MHKRLAILAIVILSGCTQQPATLTPLPLPFQAKQEVRSYKLQIGKWNFGFQDIPFPRNSWPDPVVHMVHLGPFESHGVPFTATQGFVGFCLIVVAFITLLVVLSVRWKRKRVG